MTTVRELYQQLLAKNFDDLTEDEKLSLNDFCFMSEEELDFDLGSIVENVPITHLFYVEHIYRNGSRAVCEVVNPMSWKAVQDCIFEDDDGTLVEVRIRIRT